MMDYNSFKMRIKERIKDFLPENYSDSIVELVNVQKLGDEYEGLIVKRQNNQPEPVANMQMLYEQYKQDLDFSLVLKTAAEIIMKAPEISGFDGKSMDYNALKDHLFIRLSNTERNKDVLSNVPHMEIEDLSITCHVLLSSIEDGISSYMVTNGLLDKFGISKEDLFHDAIENSPSIFPSTFMTMNDILKVDDSIPFFTMYVLSNEASVNGAASLMYKDAMEEISNRLGGDYIILPSSTHELIILKDNGDLDYESLAETVKSVNETCVEERDLLSDNVYKYDCQNHSFSILAGLEHDQTIQNDHQETLDISLC